MRPATIRTIAIEARWRVMRRILIHGSRIQRGSASCRADSRGLVARGSWSTGLCGQARVDVTVIGNRDVDRPATRAPRQPTTGARPLKPTARSIAGTIRSSSGPSCAPVRIDADRVEQSLALQSGAVFHAIGDGAEGFLVDEARRGRELLGQRLREVRDRSARVGAWN